MHNADVGRKIQSEFPAACQMADAGEEEEEMFHKVETDLPRSYGQIFLIQPDETAKINARDFGELDENAFERILNHTIALRRFIHLGTLNYIITHSGKIAGIDVTGYRSCSGEISFRWRNGVMSPVQCPKCKQEVAFYQSGSMKTDQNTLFFLALKQMFPVLPTCNFLNLSFDLTISQEIFGGIGPGLISIANDVLLVDGRLSGLGFTLLTGLDTSDDQEFGSLAKWVRVLVSRWAKFISRATDEQKFFILGPKSAR